MAHCRFKTGNGTFLKDIIEVGSINFVHKRIHKKDTALFYHIIHRMNIRLYRNEIAFDYNMVHYSVVYTGKMRTFASYVAIWGMLYVNSQLKLYSSNFSL